MPAPCRGERLDGRYFGLLVALRRKVRHPGQRVPAVFALGRVQFDELVDLFRRQQLAVGSLVPWLATALTPGPGLFVPSTKPPCLLRVARWGRCLRELRPSFSVNSATYFVSAATCCSNSAIRLSIRIAALAAPHGPLNQWVNRCLVSELKPADVVIWDNLSVHGDDVFEWPSNAVVPSWRSFPRTRPT